MSYKWRRRNRGVSFKPHIYKFVDQASKQLKVNFNLYVNKLLDAAITSGLAGAVTQRITNEFRRDQLLTEEQQLRKELNAILRSGCFLKDYAQKLLLGSQEEISRLRHRVGVYAQVDTEELDVILRILQRRENLVKELVAVENMLLPQDRYPLALSDRGWTIGHSKVRSRSHVTHEKPEREEEKTDAIEETRQTPVPSS